MLKNILKLDGTQKLTATEQKNIKGEGRAMALNCYCPDSSVNLGVVATYAECTILRMQYCNA